MPPSGRWDAASGAVAVCTDGDVRDDHVLLLRKPLTIVNVLPVAADVTLYRRGAPPRVVTMGPGHVAEVDDVDSLTSAVRIAAAPSGYHSSRVLKIPPAAAVLPATGQPATSFLEVTRQLLGSDLPSSR